MTDFKSPEYQAWIAMRKRCLNPRHHAWSNYGGRGIGICAKWSSFASFVADMGRRPSGLSLDRIDNDGNYEPGNCRWATRTENTRNRRCSRMIEWNGSLRNLSEWSEITGINRCTLADRINAGWPVDRALTVRASDYNPGYHRHV